MDTLFVLGVVDINILREKWSKGAMGESRIDGERLVERMLLAVYTSCYW